MELTLPSFGSPESYGNTLPKSEGSETRFYLKPYFTSTLLTDCRNVRNVSKKLVSELERIHSTSV